MTRDMAIGLVIGLAVGQLFAVMFLGITDIMHMNNIENLRKLQAVQKAGE